MEEGERGKRDEMKSWVVSSFGQLDKLVIPEVNMACVSRQTSKDPRRAAAVLAA